MTKKTILLIALLCFAGLCFGAAVTSSPYTGAGWNTGAPNDEALIGNTYQELQDLRKGVETRINKEHIDLASSSVGGEHMQGSARAFYLATASIPALQPDGTALASTDNGMLWHDTTTDIFYCLDDYSDPTVDGGWVSIGMLLGGVDVGASKFTVASATGNTVIAGTLGVTGASTFTAGITCNGGVTLGAGDDLIGSSTSDITINTNKFTVAGDSGNTVVAGTLGVTGASTFTAGITCNGGVTLGAGDDLIGSATSDITINTNKFTVAGATGNTVIAGTLSVAGASDVFGDWDPNDSTPAALVKDEVYKVGSDGFITVQTSAGTGDIKIYTDGSNPPTTLRIYLDVTGTGKDSCMCPVKKDDYFKVTGTAVTPIYWLPIGSGSCVKQ